MFTQIKDHKDLWNRDPSMHGQTLHYERKNQGGGSKNTDGSQKNFLEAENVAHLVECFLNMYKALGSLPALHKMGHSGSCL